MNTVAQLNNYRSPKMQEPNGFVLTYQSIDNQPWSDDPHCMLVAQYLIRKAAYSPHTTQYGKHSVELSIGQFVTSMLNLAKRSAVYGLYSKSKSPEEAAKSAIKRVVKILEADGFLSTRVIGKGKDQCTLFTLTNWQKYQSRNVSVLKPLTEPSEKPIQKPIETHATQGVQGSVKPLEKPIAKPKPSPNNNKGSKQQREVSNDTCENSGEFTPTATKQVPIQDIVNLFGEILPSLPQPKKITEARRKAIRARHINDLKSSLDSWRKYFTYIRDNCQWMTSGNYNVDFDYVIRQSTFVKVAEGAKDDRG